MWFNLSCVTVLMEIDDIISEVNCYNKSFDEMILNLNGTTKINRQNNIIHFYLL